MGKISTKIASTARKSILVLSASQYLAGRSVSETIKADWGKEKAAHFADKFDNVGFAVDPTNESGVLESLQETMKGRAWDGIIVGWCIRGHVEFTTLFEKIIAVLVGQTHAQPDLKIMFSTGPDDLVQTTIRNFSV